MNKIPGHCTSEQIQRLIDNRLDIAESAAAKEHMDDCATCRQSFDDLLLVDGSLKKMPLENTRPDFTRALMAKLIRKAKPSWAFVLLENAASVLGLLVVLGIMLAVFVWTGIVDSTHVSQSQSVANGILSETWRSVATGLHSSTSWLMSYLSLGQGTGVFGILMFVLVIVGVLAGVDRLVGRRFVHKT
jgi:anti-sigma factor RsiW